MYKIKVAESPNIRRIHSMLRNFSMEADTNFHTEHADTGMNISKVKFSLATLGMMSVLSILFALLAFLNLISVQGRSTSAGLSVVTSVNLRNVMCEIARSIALIAIITSISVFLLSTLQFFFALKMLKTNPLAVKRVLSFLSAGRYLRCCVYIVWFLGVLFFIVGSVLQVMVLPERAGVFSRNVGAVFSITSTATCIAGLIHCIYAWYSRNTQKQKYYYENGNLSTLV
ncbi:unnamed protein product [Thelazia callipaeda]|uniref:G_PROTEIN_RECEP_F1_2 domain-containing protein n=1 Tax=Thelazia callipaeda TaxID=103827 RepID=A0A0N5CUF8_THECL|nr:unnamed protein product [Thelazia callipaeda]